MKKYFILVFLVINFVAFAQNKKEPSLLVTYHLDAKLGLIKGTSFQKFVDSYNLLNINNKSKLTNFRFTSGVSSGVDMLSNIGFYVGVYTHRISATAVSVVNDYTTREFRLKQNTYGADFGYANTFKDGGFAIFAGIYLANSNIIADIKYRDGYRSIGRESRLNGIYNAFSFSSCLGAKFYKFYGRMGIMAALRWQPIFGNSYFTDFAIDENLPDDWGAYVLAGNSVDYEGEFITNRFRTVLLDLGLAVKLVSYKL